MLGFAQALVLCVSSGAAAPDVTTASALEADRARTPFSEGIAHFEAERWQQAAEKFRESYDIVASPNSHVMLGRALRGAGDLVAAWEALTLALDEAKHLAATLPRYQKAAETAQAELRELESELAFVAVRVTGTDDASVRVGERTVPAERRGRIAVAPGKIEIVAQSGERTARRVLELAPGAKEEVTLDLAALAEQPPAVAPEPEPEPEAEPKRVEPPPAMPPAAEPPPSLLPWAWLAGGVGVAGAATFAIAGSMAVGTRNDLDAVCPDRHCAPSSRDDADAGRTQQAVANVGLAIALIGGGTALTLVLAESSHSGVPARSSAPERRSLRVSLGAGSVAVGGEL